MRILFKIQKFQNGTSNWRLLFAQVSVVEHHKKYHLIFDFRFEKVCTTFVEFDEFSFCDDAIIPEMKLKARKECMHQIENYKLRNKVCSNWNWWAKHSFSRGWRMGDLLSKKITRLGIIHCLFPSPPSHHCYNVQTKSLLEKKKKIKIFHEIPHFKLLILVQTNNSTQTFFNNNFFFHFVSLIGNFAHNCLSFTVFSLLFTYFFSLAFRITQGFSGFFSRSNCGKWSKRNAFWNR